MPKWGRMAALGAISAVLIGYFIDPTLRKTFKV